MAVNKNFVIKNGLEVNTNVLVAAAAEQQVGVGTTRPYYKLHVGGGEGNRGGIGATDLTISGIATIGVAHSDSGAFRVLGISTFQGDIDLLGSAGLSTVRWDASEDRLEFKDNASVGFGSDNDLTIWHDSTGHPDDQHSYIQKKETVGGGELRIDPKAGERGIVLKSGPNDNSVNLYYDNGNVFQTTPQGVNITGVTTSKRVYVTGISTFLNTVNVSTGATITTAGNAAFAGIVTANGGIHVGTAVTIDAGTGNFAMTGIATIGGNLYVTGDIVYDEITGRNLNITGFSTFADDILFNSDNDITWDKSESALVFNDNAAIRAGTGSDFSIVHDGANTIFRETGTGGLLFYTNEFLVANAAGTETLLRGDENSAVKLFFDNTSRLETTAIGATVFGDFKTSGVGTFGSFYSVGVSTIATNTTFDSYGLSVSTGATITTLGNAAFAGIVTANGGLRVGNVGTIDSNTGNAQLTGIVTAATGNFTGNVTIGGDLNVTGRAGPANASNGSRGLIIGGTDPSSSKTSIDYVTIGTTGNAADFGDPQVGRSNACANGCATSNGRGVWSGGWPGNSMIEYVEIGTLGNSSDFGDLIYPAGNYPQSDMGLNCDGTKGYFCGGYPTTNVVQYVTIDTTGNTTDHMDLTVARYGLAGNSNDTRATQAGARGTGANVIDYFTMASTNNATDFGDLTTGFGYTSSAGDKSRGCIGAGMEGAGKSIDYYTIASTGNASSFGELRDATFQPGGVSGT